MRPAHQLVAAIVASIGFALGLADVASADQATVRVPAYVTPDRLVQLQLAGFPAGARVYVQWGRSFNPPANCCVSFVYPPDGRPGIKLNADGMFRVRMPRRYAQCVTNACGSPDWQRFQSGQRVWVSVTTSFTGDPDTSTAEGFSRVLAEPVDAESHTWAGYELTISGRATYAHATFSVPAIRCARDENSVASLWVGIGGADPQHSLPQVGVNVACDKGKPAYWAWSEWYDARKGTPSKRFKGVRVEPGDVASAQVETTDSGRSYKSSISLSHGANKTGYGARVLTNPHGLPVSHTAECIVEDAFTARGVLPFAHFAPIGFQQCVAGTSSLNSSSGWMADIASGARTAGTGYPTGTAMSPFASTRFTMVRGTQHLAQATAPESTFGDPSDQTSFVVHWLHI